jgi:hypothetical protein
MKLNNFEIIIVLILPFVLAGIYYYSMGNTKNFLFKAEDKQIAEVEEFLRVIKKEDPQETQDRLIFFLEGIKTWAEKSKERDVALFNAVKAHFRLQLIMSLAWGIGLLAFFYFKKRKSL